MGYFLYETENKPCVPVMINIKKLTTQRIVISVQFQLRNCLRTECMIFTYGNVKLYVSDIPKPVKLNSYSLFHISLDLKYLLRY